MINITIIKNYYIKNTSLAEYLKMCIGITGSTGEAI